MDYFHFGVTFWGIIFAVAGVVIVSLRTTIFGLVLVAWAMTYFLVNCGEE